MKQLVIYTRVDDRNTMNYIHRFLKINLNDEQVEMYKKLVHSIQETNGIGMISEFKGWGEYYDDTNTEEGWAGHEPYDPEVEDKKESDWEVDTDTYNFFGDRFKDKSSGVTYNRINISNDMTLIDSETGEETCGFMNM